MRWWLVLLFVLGCSRREEAAPTPGSAQMRVISLTPSATEVLAALGAINLIVGVDDYSTFPPEVKALPKVGSFLSPNLETIVSLKPTLVVVDDVHGPAAGAMRDAGLVIVECPIHALPDVKKALETIGSRIGRTAEATRAIAEIEAALETARAKRPAKRPRVLAILDREAGGL
ncbi:MAG: ABC transporter substrate-binding protein, partial [Deltaproteobacteria bacterium]|nr:ABC transporter substrate-binding protein [Deltaproteobacteria bacterium]